MRSLFLLTAATLAAAWTPPAQAQFTTRSPYGQPRYNDPLGITIYDPVQEMMNRNLGRHPYSGPGMGLRHYDPLSRYDMFGRPTSGQGFMNPHFGPSFPGRPSTVIPGSLGGGRQQREEERRGLLTAPHVFPHVHIPHGGSSTYMMPTPSYKLLTSEFKLPEYKSPPATSSFGWWMGGAIGAAASGIAGLFRVLGGRKEN